MNEADRALLAEIAERDRDWPLDYRQWPRFVRPDVQPSWDRRELLRIVRELDHLLRERDTLAEDLADDAAAAEATKGRWGGG